jgi:p-hydroxybenzoate 3-monooxygenase
MTYANHDRGFALCSRRSPKISRHYVQVAPDEDAANWSDDRFWNELHIRMNDTDKSEIVEGHIFQKGVTPVRAFVAAPMRYGRLFLAGDAAHIVPPTGARGLNSAASDIYYLYHAMLDHYKKADDAGLDGYSQRALARVWKAQRFSWWMTMLLHRFPDRLAYEDKLQDTDIAYLFSSEAAQRSLAENYVGLPF